MCGRYAVKKSTLSLESLPTGRLLVANRGRIRCLHNCRSRDRSERQLRVATLAVILPTKVRRGHVWNRIIGWTMLLPSSSSICLIKASALRCFANRLAKALRDTSSDLV